MMKNVWLVGGAVVLTDFVTQKCWLPLALNRKRIKRKAQGRDRADKPRSNRHSATSTTGPGHGVHLGQTMPELQHATPGGKRTPPGHSGKAVWPAVPTSFSQFSQFKDDKQVDDLSAICTPGGQRRRHL